MKIKYRTWCLFAFLALASIAVWLRFSYPQFSFIDFSVDRAKALKIAERYLTATRNKDISTYRKAVVFISDANADRYLQRTLGFKGEHDFIQEHDFDLFLWIIRFFKENQKEEFRIAVSAATGQIASFQHIIDDTEPRNAIN